MPAGSIVHVFNRSTSHKHFLNQTVPKHHSPCCRGIVLQRVKLQFTSVCGAHSALERKQQRNNRLICSSAEASAPVSAASCSTLSVKELKSEVRKRLVQLSASQGPAAALLPGSYEEKAEIDALLDQLQRHPEAGIPSGGQLDSLVLGEWDMVYASNGTAVTRTPLASSLVAMGRLLPGAGLSDIRQTLSACDQGAIAASNEVLLGLGPLGSWRVGVAGKWLSQAEGDCVRVVFESLNLKLVGLMGLTLPEWMPQVPINVGRAGQENRAGANWVTTYVDQDMRLGKGKATGNLFLFFRKQSSSGR